MQHNDHWYLAEHGIRSDTLAPHPPLAAVGDQDPVCGMVVTPDAPHQTRYAEHTLRFCCAGCLAKFEADPQRYLTSAPEPAETAPPGTDYTCPMHPEIRQCGPGNCSRSSIAR